MLILHTLLQMRRQLEACTPLAPVCLRNTLKTAVFALANQPQERAERHHGHSPFSCLSCFQSLSAKNPTPGSFGQRIGMYRHPLNLHRFHRPVFLVHLNTLNPGQCREALVSKELSEYGVEPVQVRRSGEGDEELATVGVGPLVGHADDPPLVVTQSRSDLVLKGAAEDGPSALGVVGRVGMGWGAGLRHEGRDQAVERGAVIIGGRAEGEEVLERRGNVC